MTSREFSTEVPTDASPAFLDLSESQRRQYIDAETVYAAYTLARKAAAEVRGSMIWREMSGRRYLIRTSARGDQKSLGAESEETRQIYGKFMARKEAASSRLKSLTAELQMQQRLCRAVRVGRVPNIVTGVLNVLEDANLGQHFRVVGTHALFAYESAAGVRIQERAMATKDVDLLFDTRNRVAFEVAIEKTNASMLSLLRKADPTFEMVPLEKCTLRNAKGFEIDIVRRNARDGDPHPMRMSKDEDDIWPVQIGSGELLLSARKFDQMVVSVSGEMAMMRTVHPLDFARIKRSLAQSPNRDPNKRGKDLLQAEIVTRLVYELLPNLIPDQTATELLRRAEAIPGLKKSAGAAYTLWSVASEALRMADGDATAVDWNAVNHAVVMQSIGENSQPPDSVFQVICEHSPGAITEQQRKDVGLLVDSTQPRSEVKAPGLQSKHSMDR